MRPKGLSPCVTCGANTGSRKRKYCDPCRKVYYASQQHRAGLRSGDYYRKAVADAERIDSEVTRARIAARRKFAFWTRGHDGKQTNQGYAISQPGPWR